MERYVGRSTGTWQDRGGWFIFGWPHTTVVIRETASDERWAVESWLLDTGQPPWILPPGVWRAGWQPEDQAPSSDGWHAPCSVIH